MLTLLATMAVLASATTLPATEITATSATLNGEVAGVTEAHFEYGRTTSYGAATADQTVSDGPVSAAASPLTPNTTYHFRIVADDVPGNDQSFRTLPNPTPPRVTDQRSADVTTDAATVSGSLDPNGAATTYYFQYGRTTGYGTRTARLDAGDAMTASRVTARLAALRPYTLYHWRLVATNSVGITRGPDRTFRTGRLATALTLFSSRKVVPYGRGVMVGGRVSGAGVRGMTLALEQQRFPASRFTEVATTHAGEDGGYLFSVDHVRRATRFRVVSRTQNPLTSAVALVRSRPRTTIGARLLSRKRARVSGTIKPAVTGELSLQRWTRGGWKQVRHRAITGATTFGFKVTRVRKVNRAFRVVVLPVRGAYVKAKSKSVIVSRRPGRARGHQAAAG